MKPKAIGTHYETSVVRYLRMNGFPHAERRALAGIHDLGDITGTPGVVWECKAGQAAYTASDAKVLGWLDETETERVNARADIGVLVLDRSGYGPVRAGETWAVLRCNTFQGEPYPGVIAEAGDRPLRVHLAAVALMLRASGFGEPLDETPVARLLRTTRLTA